MATLCFSSALVRPCAPVRARVACGAARETWYPGAVAPKYLDGSLAGDFGFDPLRLGANPDRLAWYYEAELYNGRVAMMAVAGIYFTDVMGLPKFWLAGAETYALDNQTLVAIEVALFAVFEYKRYENFKTKGQTGFLGMAPFDPLGMKSPEMEQKEMMNGRLAMISFVGYCSQAAVRGLGPVDSVALHLQDPNHNNICTSAVGPEVTAAVIAMSIAPIVVEAKNALTDEDEEEDFNPIPF